MNLWASALDLSVINQYVKFGLNSDAGLKQKKVSILQAEKIVKEKSALYFPLISFEGRYSIADGGREIAIPEISQVFNLLRKKEQTASVRIMQPLFYAKNHNELELAKLNFEKSRVLYRQYYQDQVTKIKKGYIQYLSAYYLKKEYKDYLELTRKSMEEGKRKYQSGDFLDEKVNEIEIKCLEIEKQYLYAVNAYDKALLFFLNLLSLSSSHSVLLLDQKMLEDKVLKKKVVDTNIKLEKISKVYVYEILGKINLAKRKKIDSFYRPSISALIDLGVESESLVFNSDSMYWIGAVVFRWNLYDGNRKVVKKEKEVLEAKKLELKRESQVKAVIYKQQQLDAEIKLLISVIDINRRLLNSKEIFVDDLKRKVQLGGVERLQVLQGKAELVRLKINAIRDFFSYCQVVLDLENLLEKDVQEK